MSTRKVVPAAGPAKGSAEPVAGGVASAAVGPAIPVAGLVGPPREAPRPPPATPLDRLALLRGPGAPADTVRRTITYRPADPNEYARSRAGLLARLTGELPHVDPAMLQAKVVAIEGAPDPWSPYDAYRGIKNWAVENYPPAHTAYGGATQITPDEARHYFVANFKTFAEVVVDGVHGFKFTNNTEHDTHAEDNFMAAIDKFVEQNNWHQDFTGTHTIEMTINNSPCIRCAGRLYDWAYRDVFVEFTIRFANMYEKGANFTRATTKLRSGGVTMNLYSVTANLAHLLSAAERGERQGKDNREALDFAAWLKTDQ